MYCDIVRHSCKSSDKRKLERVQEHALRAVFKSKSESCGELLERAYLSTLCEGRLQNRATLTYEVNKGQAFPCTVHYGKHLLHYLGPFLWSK